MTFPSQSKLCDENYMVMTVFSVMHVYPLLNIKSYAESYDESPIF